MAFYTHEWCPGDADLLGLFLPCNKVKRAQVVFLFCFFFLSLLKLKFTLLYLVF